MNKKQAKYVKSMDHYGSYTDPDTDKHVVRMCCYCNGKNQGYMVKFELWNKTIPKKDHRKMVCLGCFEEKLGRSLVTSDFTDASINYGIFGFNHITYCRLGES